MKLILKPIYRLSITYYSRFRHILNPKTGLIFVLFLMLAFVRLYRIGQLTEFLGDQGSAGIIIYESWVNKNFPLHGPPSSTGQYVGPIYYYLMAPAFILSGFNAVAPAVVLVLFGILSYAFLFDLLNRRYGFRIAFVLIMLFGFSPFIVEKSRNLWTPTLIPPLIILLIYFMDRIWFDRKYGWAVYVGLITGILVQLHYSNLYILAMYAIFWVALLFFSGQKLFLGKWLRYALTSIGAFLITLIPFIIYEFQNRFTDVSGLVRILLFPENPRIPLHDFLLNYYNFSIRLTGFLTVRMQLYLVIIIFLSVLTALFIKKSFFHIFLSCWLVGGMALIARSNLTIFDHYLFFLLPVPIFLIAYVIFCIKNIFIKNFILLSILILSINQIRFLDLNSPGVQDISRTKNIISKINTDSGGKPFSFTLISSRSFSDMHYRYFMTLAGIQPQPIINDTYRTLYLICEHGDCPDISRISSMKDIQAMCWEHVCGRKYPMINMAKWHFVRSEDAPGAVIYVFER